MLPNIIGINFSLDTVGLRSLAPSLYSVVYSQQEHEDIEKAIQLSLQESKSTAESLKPSSTESRAVSVTAKSAALYRSNSFTEFRIHSKY